MAMDKNLQPAKTPEAPAPNGNDALAASDTIIREAQRWDGLRSVAARLKATGSLEAAATAAEMRVKNASSQLADYNARIADAVEHLGQQTDKAESVMKKAKEEEESILSAAKHEVEVAGTRAASIVADANSNAQKIVALAQLEGEALVAKVKNDNAQGIAASEAKQKQLEAMDADIAKRQETLNGINDRLSDILGKAGG